ncbi:MAG: ion transporter [Pseudomonadota bacterium]|nr:ion transporter [Pseudomonadota bacterium]
MVIADAKDPEHRIRLIDWLMLLLAVVSIGLLVYETWWVTDEDVRALIIAADVTICAIFAAEFVWRWRAFGYSRRFVLVNWYEILGMIPVSHPAIRGFRLFRVIRIIIMLSRFGMAADRAFGETFTHNLLTRLRQWVVNLIGGAVTIYVLDEVADVLHKGTYTRNVARALEQHTDEIEHAVRETVYADPNLGRLRRLPFFDAIVSTSTQVTQRVIIEFLQNERTDRLVADILHENIEQIRMSVRAREDQRALARRKPHETADTT